MWILLYPLTFCICLLYNLKGKGLNASSFILLLYFLSSICGVCLHLYHPDYIKIEISLQAVVHHLSCLFLILDPILQYGNTLSFDLLYNKQSFKRIAIIISLFSLLGIISDIPNYYLAFSQPLAAVRAMNVEGGLVNTQVGLKSYLIAIGHSAGPFCLFLFFYFRTFLKVKYYLLLLFIASLTNLSSNILAAGRGETFRFIYQFILFYLILKPYMKTLSKPIVFSFSVVIIGFLYFVYSVTASRFGSENVLLNIADYFGQGFVNYSRFYDSFQEPTFWGRKSFSGLFPTEYRVDSLDVNSVIRIGFYLNVFSTFIGSFLFDFGTCGTLIFSFILFSILSFLFNSKISNFIKLFFYIYSCDIVMFGVFYYNLSKSTALLSLIVLFMLVVFLYSNVFHYKFKL